ncbi:MinD-like ATPase involved in chromosome partitioning or flagellar assembly [Ruminiclostridium sufflavum DSM 19573]|uniref:MinD-like ATPase involved in chromosome partitioning or flagellar assembly n=1 Tax=Ruminiclostridium sufflavum DSM 19573 TaxID=1121337 RepID=A0A318XJT5_9FIRM|nr:AAA family ATPase [Ruminiclostridium sufflavum]PYG86796.1 MinD-like ATPase involved in chromosome partitioning or flagellar assembly [Ruminiclostridium sufflavum DSM 19573]
MLNFKKNTIFCRGTKEETVKEDILHSGVLAVWGSPGSGKTTTAVKLAKYLADKKKNVVLVLCDMTAPMLPCICPPSDLECEKNSNWPYGSLGSILSAAHVTEPLVKYNMITHKKMSYLTMIGMLKGENEYTYASYSKVQAQELIESLRKIAPYVIIDCGSYIANDILSAVSLLECDSVLRLANCDLKSISYLSSQLQLLQSSKWDMDKQYKVASNVKSNHDIDHMAGALGAISFKLPYSEEVEEQYLAGNLLADLTLKNSRELRKGIEKIAKEVFGC